MPYKVAVTGCFGRMGRELTKALQHYDLGGEFELYCGVYKDDESEVYKPDFKVVPNINDCINDVDLVVDFTNPRSSLGFALACEKHGKALITGTTGFTTGQMDDLKKYSHNTPVFCSSNMSVGVSIFKKAASICTSLLGDEYDVEILEMHHSQKSDAPSGTALMIGEAIAHAQCKFLSDISAFDRAGSIHPRQKGDIGFASLRGGSVVGDHSVIFAGNDDIITLSHRALNRAIFAKGVFKVATWFMKQKPGKIYDMDDFIDHLLA